MTHCQTIIDNLRQRGYRITPQREMIIEAIAHSPQHITAEEISEKLQEHTRAINIATVYRTLD
ncbi:MAG: transcriptional repressor, partial [Anaerolineales bacterium]|nr:transcriptional repressor [Anaerolineales bacterium]